MPVLIKKVTFAPHLWSLALMWLYFFVWLFFHVFGFPCCVTKQMTNHLVFLWISCHPLHAVTLCIFGEPVGKLLRCARLGAVEHNNVLALVQKGDREKDIRLTIEVSFIKHRAGTNASRHLNYLLQNHMIENKSLSRSLAWGRQQTERGKTVVNSNTFFYFNLTF